MGEHEGKEVLGLRVSWNKRYITLAPVATVLGLAFRVRDPDGLIGDQDRSSTRETGHLPAAFDKTLAVIDPDPDRCPRGR